MEQNYLHSLRGRGKITDKGSNKDLLDGIVKLSVDDESVVDG